MGNKVSQENNLLRKEKHQTIWKMVDDGKNGLESSKEDLREAEAFLKKKGVPIDSVSEDDVSEAGGR